LCAFFDLWTTIGWGIAKPEDKGMRDFLHLAEHTWVFVWHSLHLKAFGKTCAKASLKILLGY
jgi:hypothetical protein